jgi:hypothetical protein
MDNPLDRFEDDLAPPAMDEATLMGTMERSDREVAAGLTVPLADVLAELDAAAERAEARRRARAA